MTIELVGITQNASMLEKHKTLCLKQTGFPQLTPQWYISLGAAFLLFMAILLGAR